ncbi:MAG: LD-carboxypeptidase [Spirochaetes bacterium]|nr:LD-carboxypeptidase [Spirochaetota bacterium]
MNRGSGGAPKARLRIKPRRLHKGDRVFLVAPSGSAFDSARVEASIHALESLGFEVSASPHCADVYGYLAGSDETRAAELERAFLDPDTNAVICLKGGYGTPRILDRIDYGIMAAHPKLFLGYSDITALHTAFRQVAGLVTIHGPMPSSDMVPELDPVSRSSLEETLFGEQFPRFLANPDGLALETIAAGIAEGELTGGNLSLLAATMGTPWQIDAGGKILFIEDVDEAPYRIDRMLNQLRLAGVFEACEGILIGSWTRCEAPKEKRSLAIRQILEDLLVSAGKPILAGLQAGHGKPSLTLALGVRYLLDATAGDFCLLESPFSD